MGSLPLVGSVRMSVSNGRRTSAEPQVQPITLESAAGELSGLLCQPHRPRGLLVALHGGGYRAAYWGYPADESRSLFAVASAQGFSTLALDRPGYGTSFGSSGPSVKEQSSALLLLLQRLPDELGVPGPVFLVGHSLGSIIALQMAADDDQGLIGGVAVSGVPVRYPGHMQEFMAALVPEGTRLPAVDESGIRAMFFGPEGTFDPAFLSADVQMQSPVPLSEFIDAREAPAWFPTAAGKVRVPVQYVIAEHEASSEGGREVLEYAIRSFTAAPRVEGFLQGASGHNISRHYVARAYHLRVLAFVDELVCAGK